ncbi:MAG: AAA family ATPase [Verrucomicrobiae bacterium]|nr:AAA family ATPase [Verrucomicrobiae bacterium]
MLLSFEIENFRSFADPVEFSAIASREVQLGDRLPRFRDQRLLPIAAIFGGNGSGKSNLMFALKFARQMIVNGTEADEAIPRVSFKLNPNFAKLPSRFKFEFLAKSEQVYRYEFYVTNDVVAEESLKEIRPTTEKTIFRRTTNTGGAAAWAGEYFDNHARFSDEERQIARFVAMGTRENQLFLREAIDRNIKYLKPAYDWFASSLVILDPDSSLESLETILNRRDDLRRFASESLKNADTGIAELKGEEIPLETAPEIPTEMKEEIRRKLKKDGAGLLFRSSRGERFSIYRDEGEILVSRLFTHHFGEDGKPVRFEMDEESEGTRRLIDLLPVFYDLQNQDTNRVYVIDELDRSMHSYLSRSLLEGFLASCRETSRGQLLFTTHEQQLLDQSLLRRDEIWFINKSDDGSTYMEGLSDYEGVRNDTDIRKAYLQGRFSGVPHLRPRPSVNEEDELIEH